MTLSFCLLAPQFSLAQVPPGQPGAEGAAPVSGPRKQVAVIVFSGLAGAVLGLSTLSFYERPQDKLENLGIGFALGIIVGAVVTTYSAATRPREFYGTPVNAGRSLNPELWKVSENPKLKRPDLGLSYSFDF